LLINYEAIEITIKTVRVETFYFLNHQEIYKAIVEMYKKKVSINVFSLNNFLKETGCLDKIGGTKVLLELLNQIPNLVYLEEYIQLIQDKFLRRSLINLGYETINSAYITNIPLEKILNDFEKKSFRLTNELIDEKRLFHPNYKVGSKKEDEYYVKVFFKNDNNYKKMYKIFVLSYQIVFSFVLLRVIYNYFYRKTSYLSTPSWLRRIIK
jgi:replicative DNA helicase